MKRLLARSQPVWRPVGEQHFSTHPPRRSRLSSASTSNTKHVDWVQNATQQGRTETVGDSSGEPRVGYEQVLGNAQITRKVPPRPDLVEAETRDAWPRTSDQQSESRSPPRLPYSDVLNLPAVDSIWQKTWASRDMPGQEDGSTGEHEGRESDFYVLPMFPYPSGNLHMGHMRVYTIADVLSRWKRMSGFNVLNPMGWDAFGLPAENAAIERGIDPASWTRKNIAKMRKLLKEMNTDLDWSRELATCDPSFYKHTQKLFLLMRRQGLAYQAEGMVNWDPIDKTVLANEQVDKDGFSWRSGAKVEQRSLKQWYLKVTAFQEPLLEDLNLLAKSGRWPERVISQQRNWIGRSEGAKIKFLVGNVNQPLAFRPVEVFTTRPDTLFGVQFLALSSNHPLVKERVLYDPELAAFVEKLDFLPADSKIGLRLKDIVAVNPAENLLERSEDGTATIPVFVAPYVLDNYGEGAVMGVPGHDERDYAFWRLNAPTEQVLRVVGPMDRQPLLKVTTGAYTEPGKLLPNCGKYAGLTSTAAAEELVSQLHKKGSAKKAQSWRLRDWLISRQRYWGTPIPIIHCDSCGTVSVPDKDLPVTLPALDGEYFKGKSGNPLETASEWVNTTCPQCNGPAKRDTDTMDTFVDSSWYFMRFPDAHNPNQMFSKKAAKALPVDMYIGGVEHAILHLLYARFVAKFLASINLWTKGNDTAIRGEPFHKLITQGMVHGKTYSDPDTGRFLRPEEVDTTSPSEPKIIEDGRKPALSYEKMSKSKYNGVDPISLILEHGADVVRAHTLFSAPVIDVLDWDDAKIVGVSRWLQRVWKHVGRVQQRLTEDEMKVSPQTEILEHSVMTPNDQRRWKGVQDLLDYINQSYETTSLNTLISGLMKLSGASQNDLVASNVVEYHRTSILLRAMAPVTPAFAEECWQFLHAGGQAGKSIFDQPFPVPDKSVRISEETQICTVQHNGKLRFSVQIPKPPPGVEEVDQWVITKLKETEGGAQWFLKRGHDWKRIVVVRGGKLVNFVG